MKFSVSLIPVVSASFEDIAAHVNSLDTTWKAKIPKFEDLEAVKRLLGTDVDENERLVGELPSAPVSANTAIPTDFDVRTNWPACAGVTGHIRDQSACGSCWAHGATESFNDRYCIATGSAVLLSTEDALANSGAGSCNGGQPTSVLNWIGRTGVVSGGDFVDIGKGSSCAPYSLPTCQHHNWKPPTPEHPACPDSYPTPRSFSSCKESGYSTSFHQDKVKGGSAYSIQGESNIQSEIAQYGSVSAVFTVYEDLPAYESGVYQHTQGGYLGGHAVALIGWGVEDGTPYWLVKNSWNEDWGNKGLFKIKRGNNECGIEGGISASKAASTVV